jgi:mono/diheme cytochrome c family protein
MKARPGVRAAALAVGAVVLVGAAAAVALLYSGWYSVAATEQHLRPTFRALDVGLRRSVERHARGIPVPALDAQSEERGLACFREHCAQCHGAPGIGRAEFALGMLPVPSSLSQAAHDWRPAELYWITRYGIKMTGMPAWGYRLDDAALWAIVAFLQRLPELTPAQYARLAGNVKAERCGSRDTAAPSASAGDPARGRTAIQQHACTACHSIPGVVGPASHTGPALSAMGSRKFIAGVLPNNSENMVRWLRAPQSVSPQSAMPDVGLSEADARDIAAYLASLQ